MLPTCPRGPSALCPRRPCPGATDPGVCAHLAGLARARADGPPPPPAAAPRFDPARWEASRLLVLGCDYRGGPTSASCGCAGLRACHAGKGRPVPGSNGTDVTDADCRACVGA